MRLIAIATALGVLALAGCGGDDEDAGSGDATSLRVTVRAEGAGGKAAVHTVDCNGASGKAFCRDLPAEWLAPVDGQVACTQIFGGPATATVTGTLHGQAVDAHFALTDGCEIDRWRRNAALLGQPPGNPPGGG